MTRANAKSDKWAIVINAEKGSKISAFFDLQKVIVNHFASFNASIVHDKDHEEGVSKTPHLHVFLTTPKMTKSELLTEITELLKVNKDQVSIDLTNSETLYVQYLIHKNDTDKYQYDRKAIITNDQAELDRRLDESYLSPAEKERKLVEDMVNLDYNELISNHGLEVVRRYLPLIGKLKDDQAKVEEKRQLIADYSRLERRLERVYNYARDLLKSCHGVLNKKCRDMINFEQRFQALEDFYNEQLDELPTNNDTLPKRGDDKLPF